MSFKDNLYNLVKEKGMVTYGELVNFSMEEGYKADTMTRRMRELCDQKGIEPLEKIGKRNQKYIYAYRLVSEPREEVKSFVFSPPPRDYSINGIAPRKVEKETNQKLI